MTDVSRRRRDPPDDGSINGPKRGARRDLRPHEQRILVRELAVGKRIDELCDEYNLSESSMKKFKQDHAREIAEVAANIDDQFAGLWAAKKENRVRQLQQVIDDIDDDPRGKHHEWLGKKMMALRAIAEELGQIPGRGGLVIIPVEHVIVSIDVEDIK